MCVESVYRIAPPTSPFTMHCRRISLNTFSAMSVVPEAAPAVLTDRRRVWRLLRQLQPAEPFVRHVVVDLLLQPRFGLDSVQVTNEQHSKQYLRVDCRSSIVRAVQRRAQLMDETEIYRSVYPSQQMIFRYHLLQDHQIHFFCFSRRSFSMCDASCSSSLLLFRHGTGFFLLVFLFFYVKDRRIFFDLCQWAESWACLSSFFGFVACFIPDFQR